MRRPNGRLKLLRRNNLAQVALGVHKLGPISRAELSRITGLSKPCVSGIVDELISDAVLCEIGTTAIRRGRPLMLLDINPDADPVAGVYMAPEAIEVVLANPKLQILARRTLTYEDAGSTPQEVAASIARSVRRCARMAGRPESSVRGVGVTVAGGLNTRTGSIVVMGNRPGWENVPIVRLLSEECGIPVYLENDVRAAALVREWFGKKDHEGNALYLLVCDGVGGALTQGDGLFRGDRDASVRFEHMVIQPDGSLEEPRFTGDLESLASDLAFIRLIWPEVTKTVAQMTVAERNGLVQRGVRMALRGDEKAHNALRTVAKYLGIAVANAISMLDPQVVFVCGTILDAAPDVTIEAIRKEAFARLPAHMLGADVRALQDSKQFLLRGAAGLALWQPYRVLYEDNSSARSVGVSEARRSRTEYAGLRALG